MSLSDDIRAAINRASREGPSNTPDFILADYLLLCLDSYERAVMARDLWYSQHPRPGQTLITHHDDGTVTAQVAPEDWRVDVEPEPPTSILRDTTTGEVRINRQPGDLV